MKQLEPTKQTTKKRPNKLVLGFAALVASATIGATGIAAAQTNSSMSSGYGGDTANVNFNMGISGSNNVISIILNLF